MNNFPSGGWVAGEEERHVLFLPAWTELLALTHSSLVILGRRYNQLVLYEESLPEIKK
jgi:hypothetical protein